MFFWPSSSLVLQQNETDLPALQYICVFVYSLHIYLYLYLYTYPAAFTEKLQQERVGTIWESHNDSQQLKETDVIHINMVKLPKYTTE